MTEIKEIRLKNKKTGKEIILKKKAPYKKTKGSRYV